MFKSKIALVAPLCLALCSAALEASSATQSPSVTEARRLEAAGRFEEAEGVLDRVLAARPNDWRILLSRGGVRFKRGDVEGSLADFDRVAEIEPRVAPELWQRGLSQYYEEQFAECEELFESHRGVNPADVENAAWHYLCVAAQRGPDAARREILPVGTDRRPSMSEVYQLYRGDITPEQLLSAPWSRLDDERYRSLGEFYARLYLGLWHEAHGRAEESAAQIERAIDAGSAGYVSDVARVHRILRSSAEPRDR
ncbi:MAG: tetratricopeptide repeat protein [Acidobacteriota bacterium]